MDETWLKPSPYRGATKANGMGLPRQATACDVSAASPYEGTLNGYP
jgi:hypothetical protein